MEDAARLVAAFKQLRDGKGLTVEKLNFEAARLLELLLTPGDPEAALKVLDELIDAIPDSRFAGVVGDFPPRIGKRAVAKAVRVALAIGTDDEGMPLASHGAKVTERRRWACGEDPLAPREDCFFQEGVPRTHQRYEDDQGFPALARLILHRHQVETTRAPLHEETQERPDTTGEEASLVAAESVGFATAFEPNGPDQNLALAPAAASNGRPFGRVIRAAPFGLSRLSVTPQQRRAKLAILSGTSIGIAIFATLMLAASGVIPLWPHPSSAGDRSPAANLPRVTGSVSAPPNIDNTRGWGPSRKTFTMQHPAPYPVFNSITDNPVHGNELNFVQCKDTAKDGQSWADEMVALDGHTYQCYLWVDNDVAPNLDSSAEEQ